MNFIKCQSNGTQLLAPWWNNIFVGVVVLHAFSFHARQYVFGVYFHADYLFYFRLTVHNTWC